jgi:hypothetical protein
MADPKDPTAFARHIARTKRLRLKRYHIGSSFRESSAGGQPHAFGEIGPFRVPLPRIIAQSLNTLPLQPTISSRPCDPWPQRPSSSLCSTGSSTRSPVSLSASGSSTSRTLPVCRPPPPPCAFHLSPKLTLPGFCRQQCSSSYSSASPRRAEPTCATYCARLAARPRSRMCAASLAWPGLRLTTSRSGPSPVRSPCRLLGLA